MLLTHFPMSLLTGFMMKEDKKPLRYITNGMVAMKFCSSEKEEESDGRLKISP